MGVPKKLEKVQERCRDAFGSSDLPNMKADSEPVPACIWLWNPGSDSDPPIIYSFEGGNARQKLEGLALPNESEDGSKVTLLLSP